jgi:hypothetical protein
MPMIDDPGRGESELTAGGAYKRVDSELERWDLCSKIIELEVKHGEKKIQKD